MVHRHVTTSKSATGRDQESSPPSLDLYLGRQPENYGVRNYTSSRRVGAVITVKPCLFRSNIPLQDTQCPTIVVGTGNRWSTVLTRGLGVVVNTVGFYRGLEYCTHTPRRGG